MGVPFSRQTTIFSSVAVLACFLTGWPVCVLAQDKTAANLFANDILLSPHQPGIIEAKLLLALGAGDRPIAGEPLELLEDGTTVTTATTDASGTAKLRYVPMRKGNMNLTVRVGETSRFSARAAVTVAAWERRTPLLVVEMAALSDPSTQQPLADAIDELGKLTQFYYNIIYVAVESRNLSAQFAASDRARQWLTTHRFPIGCLFVLPSTDPALGARIDELRSAGWTTIKVGIGRSKEFAEAFLQRRLEAVMVPAPAKENAPKKAKMAKDWKEVRKKL